MTAKRNAFGILLFLIGAALVTARCGMLNSAPESLGNINKALAPPEVGTATPPTLTAAVRSSQGGCESANAVARMKNALSSARLMACLTAAAEDAGLISRPTSGYNYYQYTPSAGSAGVFSFRYGTDQKDIHLNACRNNVRAMELVEATQGTKHLITTTQEWVWSTTGQQVISQTAIAADNDFNFVSANTMTTGANLSGSIGIVKGLPNTLFENFIYGATTVQVFAAFDGNQGSSWMQQSNAVETWRNDTSFACQSPGAYVLAAKAHSSAGAGSSVNPAYLSRWDCALPTGVTATPLTIKSVTVEARMQACITQFSTPQGQEQLCSNYSPCS